jgi:hypothetical protein
MPGIRVETGIGLDRPELDLTPGVGLFPASAEILRRLAVLALRTGVPDLDPGAGKRLAPQVQDDEAQRQGRAPQSCMDLGAPRGVQAIVGRDRRWRRGAFGGRTHRHGRGRRRGAGWMRSALEVRQECSQQGHRHHHHEEFHQPSSHPDPFDAGARKPAGGNSWQTRGHGSSGGRRADGDSGIWRF